MPYNFFHRRRVQISNLLLSTLLLVLSGCSRTTSPAELQLESRAGADPMNVVETYLTQYQPGPTPRLFQTTHIYDRNGTLIAELSDEGRRTWVAITGMSPHLLEATIATEDASFFANSGIDPLRMVSALLRNTQQGEIVSGASTITMQLARNLFLGPDQRYDQSFDRKLLEVGLAQELTALYSKGELLEMYLNLLNYGNLAYGPAAAAQRYFGKSAATLTLAEASMLAGIPQQPANLDPYRNFDGVKRRQRIVLDLMVRHGYLTASLADATFAEAITLQARPTQGTNLAPHFVQLLSETLDARFGQGYTRRAGLNITTTLDLPMQQAAQGLVARKVAELRDAYDLSNGALVAMRPPSGEVLVMVGSADFNNEAIAGQVNVARSLRQPGSAIKPILYATALAQNLASPATVLWDTPVTYTVSANEIYAPHNYDGAYHGPVTLRTALANSYNVPTVKLLAAVGVEGMLTAARAMGVRSLNQPADWYGLSLTLGGGEVTLLDLTTAYHTLASEGQYLPPQLVLAISDALQRPVYLETPPQAQQVIQPETAFLISDILSDNEARTPAFGAQSPLQLSRPAAVKTGTTTDWRDNWTVGYTRYLVAGVWAGNSDGHPMRSTSGVTGAAPLWHDFMELVLADPALLAVLKAPADPAAWAFTPPPTVVQLSDCPPGVRCRQGGEYFTESWVRTLGTAGVLGESVERVKSAPVYLQRGESGRQIGFCGLGGSDLEASAVTRTLLRMPNPSGVNTLAASQPITTGGTLATVAFLPEVSSSRTPTNTPTLAAATSATATLSTAQLQTIGWAIGNSSALNFGPCDQLGTLLPQALALLPLDQVNGIRLLVDLAAAGSETVANVAGDGSVEVAALARAVDVEAGLVGGGNYRLAAAIVHDNDCPGQYVMGRVINLEGGPVAGIHIIMRDEWGNQSSAISKNGASDYGLFDFPIPSGAPHQIYITVVDDGGNPISAVIAIPHRQGEAPDASCHHLVLQGG